MNDGIKVVLEKIEEMQHGMNQMRTDINQRFENLETKTDQMQNRMDQMQNGMDQMQTGMDQMQTDIRGIKLVIENEVNVSIKRVAEGHLDLSRNLYESLKRSNEIEMMSVRLNMLEGDVSRLKAKIG
ncbi:hypothetical protein LJC58_09555 [Lachnospiraceae bacterium OttesenSCG-928-D06]|nr:hypothetical protein [Lachnospiraceae bacterium OttesenSCG-928-D06]